MSIYLKKIFFVFEQHPYWALLYWGFFGACLGSWCQVLISRLPERQSVVFPPSHCPQCLKSLPFWQNIPIVSYLFLRGRCFFCGWSIPKRYICVEIVSALLAMALWSKLGFSASYLMWLLLLPGLLAIIYLDIDYWWIPDSIVFFSCCWVLLLEYFALADLPTLSESLWGLLLPGFLWLLMFLCGRIVKKEAMGLGDIKLLVLLVMAMGWQRCLFVLFWASLQGSVVGLLLLLQGGHQGKIGDQTPKALADDADWQPSASAIPFGPFLILAVFEVLLLPNFFLYGGPWEILGLWISLMSYGFAGQRF